MAYGKTSGIRRPPGIRSHHRYGRRRVPPIGALRRLLSIQLHSVTGSLANFRYSPGPLRSQTGEDSPDGPRTWESGPALYERTFSFIIVARRFLIENVNSQKFPVPDTLDLLYAVGAMRKLAICAFLFSAVSFAQTADIGYFRAVMLPSKEVPVVNVSNVSGVADILAHVVRDSTGQITSGTVQFLVHANFPADTPATGLHIHSGGPTVAGPVVIGTSLSAGSPQTVKAGGDQQSLAVHGAREAIPLTD